jgi:hypothetical protein
MFEEIEFEYPSVSFFEKMEASLEKLLLVNREFACNRIKQAGSQFSIQDLSSLIVRLKTEIARDFTNHENEKDEVPYLVRYHLAFELDEGCQFLNVRTILQSKHDHLGRIMYGTSIYRTEINTYISEDSYGN